MELKSLKDVHSSHLPLGQFAQKLVSVMSSGQLGRSAESSLSDLSSADRLHLPGPLRTVMWSDVNTGVKWSESWPGNNDGGHV